jgi:hypothetical protein
MKEPAIPPRNEPCNFYQNVGGTGSKCSDFLENVCVSNSEVYFSTKTRLSGAMFSRMLTPYSALTEGPCNSRTTRGGARSKSLRGANRSHDLEKSKECG